MNPNEPEMKQIIAELIHSFEGSLEIIVGSLARTSDTEKLHAALKQQINIAESGKLVTPLAIRLATSALAVVEAVRLEKQADDLNQHNH